MNKKYVVQAFDRNLKGRFDVLAEYYGPYLFKIPATIMCQQIHDELGIQVTESSLYNLKRRLKKVDELPTDFPKPLGNMPDQPRLDDPGKANQLIDQILQPAKLTTSKDDFKI